MDAEHGNASPGRWVEGLIPLFGLSLAITLLAMRLADPPDVAGNLWFAATLIVGGWATAVLLLHLLLRSNETWPGMTVAFGATMAAALAAVSDSWPVGLSAIFPIAFALAFRHASRQMGWTVVRREQEASGHFPAERPEVSTASSADVAGQESCTQQPIEPSEPIAAVASQASVAVPPEGIRRTGADAVAPVLRETETAFRETAFGDTASGDADESDEAEEAGIWQEVQQEFSRDPNLESNIARWTSPDGTQTLVALVRCRIAGPTRTTTVHLPVWPFFPGEPEVYCRVVDGGEAECRAIKCVPNGVAVEVALKNPVAGGDNGQWVVEIVAISTAAERSGTAA